MSLSVSNNINGLVRALTINTTKTDESMKRLATGQRINTAKDDAAGLAIATRMQANLKSLAVAQRNAADGMSLAQTADAAIGQTIELMTRMKELATQAANGSNDASDSAKLDKEFQELAKEVTRTIAGADFNGVKVLAGGAGSKEFIVGAASSDVISVTTTDLSAETTITAVTGGDLTDAAKSKTAMDNITTALNTLTTERAQYGAVMSRMESAIAGLSSQAEALDAARGRIMDTDYATEMASMQKTQVLQQAATAMLSQANQRPAAVLQLLR